ncbi:MAG: hypothetical protein ACE5FT_04015 [Candidatus Nanoarchaeia archaeon]
MVDCLVVLERLWDILGGCDKYQIYTTIMQEEDLKRIALCCVILGLPVLLLVSWFVEPGEYAGLEARVVGKVTRVYSGNPVKFYVEETRLVPVVSFEDVVVEKGMVVEVLGKGGPEEFIADSVGVYHPS